MRVRWVVLILTCVFAVYVLIDLVAEFAYYTGTVSTINRTMIVAAEQAVTQVLASDELFSADSASADDIYANTEYSTIYVADSTAGNYTPMNLFDTVYKSSGNKEALYKQMYQHNNVFSDENYMSDVCAHVTTEINGVTVPLIARMGLLSGGNSVDGMLQGGAYEALKDAVELGGYPQSMARFGNRDWMHLYEIRKEYTTYGSNKEYYFLAPTNVGITYLDPNLLQTAFATNMDLLMRAKFAQNDNLTAGVGIPTLLFGGSDKYVLSDDARQTVKAQNIITDGRFAYVKGEMSMAQGVGYTGGVNKAGVNIVPTVSYKVVDVCDPANERLVRMAVTEIAGDGSHSDYVDWLNAQGIDATQPHYCVVAKITFYADIIIPYGTEFSRLLYSLYGRMAVDTATDFFQIRVKSEDLLDSGAPDFHSNDAMISAVTGNPYYTYTTYVAIMP